MMFTPSITKWALLILAVLQITGCGQGNQETAATREVALLTKRMAALTESKQISKWKAVATDLRGVDCEKIMLDYSVSGIGVLCILDEQPFVGKISNSSHWKSFFTGMPANSHNASELSFRIQEIVPKLRDSGLVGFEDLLMGEGARLYIEAKIFCLSFYILMRQIV